MSFGGGFPGAPGAPGAPGPQAGLVFHMPPDPTWEPIETTDTLEMDGYYSAEITKESARLGSGNQKAGVWITFTIRDTDAAGKRVSKFIQDPNTTAKDTWFVLRGLVRSITGNMEAARAGFPYTPGMFTGHPCYLRTGAYLDNDGATRTGVDAFVTAEEYNAAVARNGHRWPSKTRSTAGSTGAVGALPGGVPSAFPMGIAGLPGAPSAPGVPAPAPMAPAPVGPPMQPAASPIQPPAPAAAPPPSPFTGFPPPAGITTPAPAPSPFAGLTPPPPPVAPPAPANGAPPPVVGSPFPTLPGAR
jgi:hypothetical protein